MSKTLRNHPAVAEYTSGPAIGVDDYKHAVFLKEGWKFQRGRTAGCRTGHFQTIADFRYANPIRSTREHATTTPLERHTMTNNQQRIANEKANVRKIIRTLHAAGFRLGYHDGEEMVAPVGSPESTLMAKLHSTDEAHIVVRGTDRGDGEPYSGSVYLVFGNSSYEIVCNFSTFLEDLLWPVIDDFDHERP